MSPSIYTYTYAHIPLPASTSDLQNYIALRLLGLKTNPEAFGSNHAREAQNTLETWRGRIEKPARATFYAAESENGEWIGTASIVCPEMLVYGAPDGSYMLIGMWVHPDHRRRGVGKGLVQTAIEWVRERTEGQPDDKRRVSLEVHRPNTGAKAMYERLGFRITEGGHCEDPERIPMFVVAK